MDVTVERYMRRKIVTDSASPQFFYLRQKPGTCKTVDVDTLAAAIQKSCAMTKGDVKHVIEALVEEVQENLANGNKVKLNLFGTFHMTFCCPGVATSAECTVKNIKSIQINFRPSSSVRPNLTSTRAGDKIEFLDLEAPKKKKGDGSGEDNKPGGGGNEGGGGDEEAPDPTV